MVQETGRYRGLRSQQEPAPALSSDGTTLAVGDANNTNQHVGAARLQMTNGCGGAAAFTWKPAGMGRGSQEIPWQCPGSGDVVAVGGHECTKPVALWWPLCPSRCVDTTGQQQTLTDSSETTAYTNFGHCIPICRWHGSGSGGAH
jgi:hypothetical protein